MQHDSREVLHRRLQAERGTIIKNAGQVRLRFALAYPNTYFVGMSNLGLQTMYRVINHRSDTVCERVFLPDTSSHAIVNAPLQSLESQRPVRDFHILGFSVSYENDYVNVLQMLEWAHIPLLASERDERHPLIMIGGAVTYINPEPLADFADLMIIGDGEEAIHEYLDIAVEELGQERVVHLRQAADVPGIYVPSMQAQANETQSLAPRKITDLAQWPAYSSLLTEKTEFSNTLLVEITRGCPWKCRFCTVGYVYPKFRQLPAELVLGLVDAQRERDLQAGREPIGKVGLISSATGDYRHLSTVAHGLVELGVAIGISSLRMDRMPDVLIDCMVRSGVRSCTVAPEAGSERLRQFIRKDMTESDILSGVDRLLEAGMRNLKLYSMIGLPTETDADVQELIALAFKIWDRMKRHGRARGALGTLTLSVNPFVPKPATPLQWCAMAPRRAIEVKLQTLRQAIRKESHIRLKHESLKSAYLEAILARGDRGMSRFLLEVHRQQGNWRRAAKQLDFDVASFVGNPIDTGTPLVWDFLAGDRQRQRLHREHDRALALPLVPT